MQRFTGEFSPLGNVASATWVQSFDYYPERWFPKLNKAHQFTGEYAPLGNVPSAPFNVSFDTYDMPRRTRRVVRDFSEQVTYTLGVPGPIDFWEAPRRRKARVEGFAEFTTAIQFPSPVDFWEVGKRRKLHADGFIGDSQFVARPTFAPVDEFPGALQRRKLLPTADKDELSVVYTSPPIVQFYTDDLDLTAVVRKRFMPVVFSHASFDVYQYFVFIQMWSHDNLASLTQLMDSPGLFAWSHDNLASLTQLMDSPGLFARGGNGAASLTQPWDKS
jgi:hypothetical protein